MVIKFLIRLNEGHLRVLYLKKSKFKKREKTDPRSRYVEL